MGIKNTINKELLGDQPNNNVFKAIVQAKDQIKDIIQKSGLQMTGQLEATLDILNNKSDELRQEFDNFNKRMSSFDE